MDKYWLVVPPSDFYALDALWDTFSNIILVNRSIYWTDLLFL